MEISCDIWISIISFFSDANDLCFISHVSTITYHAWKEYIRFLQNNDMEKVLQMIIECYKNKLIYFAFDLLKEINTSHIDSVKKCKQCKCTPFQIVATRDNDEYATIQIRIGWCDTLKIFAEIGNFYFSGNSFDENNDKCIAAIKYKNLKHDPLNQRYFLRPSIRLLAYNSLKFLWFHRYHMDDNYFLVC